MADIRTLQDSMAVSADHGDNSQEMQRLKYEVSQYEDVIPIYRARIKDMEDANQRLLEEKQEFIRNIKHLRDRLNKAERLVFSMGTPEFIKKRGTSREHERKEEGSEQTSSSDDEGDEDDDVDKNEDSHKNSFSSSSSDDEHDGTESQQVADQNMGAAIDLSVSHTEPSVADKGTKASLPANKPSFKEALGSSKGHLSRDVAMDGSAGNRPCTSEAGHPLLS